MPPWCRESPKEESVGGKRSPVENTQSEFLAACMGGFSLGAGIGWSAPCVEILKDQHDFDVFSTNVVASVFPLGAAVGMPVVPFVIDKIGRKWTMMSLVPAFVLGWVFIAIGVNTTYLLTAGRLITGACGGMFCVVAPMYSAEICEKEIRGTRWGIQKETRNKKSKEMFFRGYHWWILHLRFDGNTCKEAAVKLTLNFKNLFFVLRSTHHEGKTFSRNHRSQPNSFLEKRQKRFLII